MPDRAPKKIKPKALRDYLEVMTKAVFQSGMSWRVIDAKWDGFRVAFEGFDAKKVALDREHKGFRNYLRSHGSFEETVADLKRHFSFLGETGSYYFLYVVGE